MRQSPDISKVKEISPISFFGTGLQASSHTPRLSAGDKAKAGDDNNIFDNFLRLSLSKLILWYA